MSYRGQRPWLWIVIGGMALGVIMCVIGGGNPHTFIVFFVVGLIIGGLVKVALKRPGNGRPAVLRVLLAVTLAWGAITAFASSSGVDLIAVMLYLLGGMIFGGVTLITGIVLAVRGRRAGRSIARLVPLSLMLQVLVLGIVFWAVSLDGAFRVRFLASRASLESAALSVQSGDIPSTPGSIGLFRVSRIDVLGTAVRFVVGDCGLFDKFGVVYSPTGEPPILGEDTYRHLDGPWWAWIESF